MVVFFQIILAVICSVHTIATTATDYEYLYHRLAVGEDREAKYYFFLKCEHFTSVDASKKVVLH